MRQLKRTIVAIIFLSIILFPIEKVFCQTFFVDRDFSVNNPINYNVYIGNIFAEGTTAYFVGPSSLHVFDCSSPKEPQTYDLYESEYYTESCNIFLKEGFAFQVFSGSNFTMQILDLRNPENIAVIGGFQAGISSETFIDKGVMVEEDFAYVVGKEGWLEEEAPSTLSILNCSDYTNPFLVGQFIQNDTNFSDIFVKNHFVYLVVDEDEHYQATNDTHLEILDVQDPTQPRRVGEWFDFDDIITIFVQDDFLYLLDADDGFVILDISDPEQPITVIQQEDILGWQLFIFDELAYITSHSKLQIYDISNFESIQKIGEYTDQSEEDGWFYSSYCTPDFTYLLRSFIRSERYFYIIDCRAPANPKKLFPTGLLPQDKTAIIVAAIGASVFVLPVMTIALLNLRKKKNSPKL